MTRGRNPFVAAVAAVAMCAGLGAACGNNTPTTPTTPEPTIFTEVFSGTLTPNGAVSHVFFSQASGTVRVSLTSLAPDPALAIGVALGTWTGSACQVIIANDRAVLGAFVNGAVGNQGGLCVRAYDATGSLVAETPVTYELTVEHP